MASLYDLLCYHSLTSTDPLLEELLSYLPTRFHSHIFDNITCEYPRMMNQLILSTISLCFLFRRFNLLCLITFISFLFFMKLQNFLPRRRAQDIQKGLGALGPRLPRSRRHRRAAQTASAFPGQSRQETAAATADGWNL